MTAQEARDLLADAPCANDPSKINPGLSQKETVDIVRSYVAHLLPEEVLSSLIEKRVRQVCKVSTHCPTCGKEQSEAQIDEVVMNRIYQFKQKICGNCETWMKCTCPRESWESTPTIGSIACAEFVLSRYTLKEIVVLESEGEK